MKIVLACRLLDVTEWAKANNMRRQDYLYLQEPEQIAGMEIAAEDVVCLSGHNLHPRFGDLVDALELRVRK